jgi:hypothetical protein
MVNIMRTQVEKILEWPHKDYKLPPHYEPQPIQPLAVKLYLILTKIESTALPFRPTCLPPFNPKYVSKKSADFMQKKDVLKKTLQIDGLLKAYPQNIYPDHLFESVSPHYLEKDKKKHRLQLLKQGYRFLIYYTMLSQAHKALTNIHQQYNTRKRYVVNI